MFKSTLALALLSFSLANARSISFVCSDTTVSYDIEALKKLEKWLIKSLVAGNVGWDDVEGRNIEPHDGVRLKVPYITSQGLALMIKLSEKSDEQAFAFINSLNDQAFKLLCIYANGMEERRIAELLGYKILLNPALATIAEVDQIRIDSFADNKAWKLLDELMPYDYYNHQESQNKRKFLFDMTIEGKYFVALVHFYKEKLKKPLIVNTDRLKQLYQAIPDELKKMLIDKNLIALS